MDFGFAPGTTLFEDYFREMLPRRSGTTRIPASQSLKTVREFIRHVNSDPANRPVGDFLLGTHGNKGGYIGARMFPDPRMFPYQQGDGTDFEKLVESLDPNNPQNSINIPDLLIGFNAGDPVTHSFHIKGCNVGKARPFLLKMKEALGDHVKVTAPKHFSGYSFAELHGVWEWMCYEYWINRPEPFADEAAMIAEFRAQAQAGKFKRIDGSNVPVADLLKLMTKALTTRDGTFPSRLTRVRQPVGSRRNNITISQGLRITNEKIPLKVGPFDPPRTVPKTPSEVSPALAPIAHAFCLQALEQELLTFPEFKATHPFPYHIRRGYASIADFINGFRWTFSNVAPSLFCVGEQEQYTVLMPITDLSTGKIIVNFYPNIGSGPVSPVGLHESNDKLFESV